MNRTYKPSDYKPMIEYGNNPIAQAFEALGFIGDPRVGYRFLDGLHFIGEKKLVSFQQLIDEIKSSKKKVVLNIGDSTTTGWDVEVFIRNIDRFKQGKPIELPYFKYNTYSDILRDHLGDTFVIINAGVIGYSSLQGSRRLDVLLRAFKKNGVMINYVTSYLGNNDSTANSWLEDKQWIGILKSKVDHDGIDKNRLLSLNNVITRIAPEDYKKNLINILLRCRSENIIPIFIEPITSIYWQPGIFDKNQMLPQNVAVAKSVKDLLEESVKLWSVAVKVKKYSDMKRLLLEEAREKDYILTRIKKSHLKIYKQVVEDYNVPNVSVSIDRTKDDTRFFMDFCHPQESAYKLLADGIINIIADFERGHRKDLVIDGPLTRIPQKKSVKKKQATIVGLNTGQYTLY